MTEEEIKKIDARWKSDVDRKLDRLMDTADKFDTFYDKHSELLRMLLNREATRKKWRDAVMEKTLAGLVWASIAFVLAACWDWVQRHTGTRT